MEKNKIEEILNLVRNITTDEFSHPFTTGTSYQELIQEINHLSAYLTEQKKRKHDIIEHIMKCFSGDFFHHFTISDKMDELDVISMGLNTYIEELQGVMISKDSLLKVNQELEEEKLYSKKLSDAKDEFMSNMSHEIRTPLNGIIGFTDILLKNNSNIETNLEQLKSIKSSGGVMLSLINNFIELENLNSHQSKINLEKINIPYLINSISLNFEDQIKTKNINFELSHSNSDLENLLGDSSKLTQIFTNLISNSLKFTPSNGKISISSTLIKIKNNQALIEFIIEDTGIGIAQENLLDIFQPYTQNTGDYARTFGGSGIGLTVVQKIIELLKGTIQIESKLKIGTKITFQIPFNEMEVEKDSIETNLKEVKTIRILIAEDNVINQLLISTILKAEGFDIEMADDGKQAIEALEKSDFDIILMDLMMPEMNGYEASEYIRTKMNGAKSTIPILAVSADVTADVQTKCKSSGMNDYISKPYDSKQLINKINNLIASSK